MISSFWNFCRACPSVPVEKLHTEYRSTFQGHEYLGKSNPAGKSVHHAVVQQPKISNPSVSFSGEGERRGKRVNISNINNTVNGWWLTSSEPTNKPHHHQSQQFGKAKLETQLLSEESGEGPKKSISLGIIRALDTQIPVQTHQPIQNNNNNAESSVNKTTLNKMEAGKGGQDSLNWTENKGYQENMASSYDGPKTSQLEDGKNQRREYKSEYKKQFRPFSQYEYVDGRFFKKRGEQEDNPWYKEVIELRKKAGEYRYRGWGTELVPQHLADVYHQNVWDQVSGRSSLAALALITTTTKKSISKEEKEKENVRKSLPKRSLSRPNTATPKHPISDSKMKDSETVQGAKKMYDGPPSVASRASRGNARSQSAGPGGRSPRKSAHSSLLTKEKDTLDASKPLPRHPRPSSADPYSLGFSEPVIKSPPEPTRVKSPEQVILRSPDPVNWTVPLDTTKSFTVTQNIRDAPPSPRFRAGERPHGVGSGHHQVSGVNSSSGSTKASSPLSSLSSRSAPPATATTQAQKLGGNNSPFLAKIPPASASAGPKATGKVRDALPATRPKSSVIGDKKRVESNVPPASQRNLNGCEGVQKGVMRPAPRLDNRKPDDSKNNNDKPSTVTTNTQPPTRTIDNKPKSVTESNVPTKVEPVRRPVPGIKCLDDPQFTFDAPKAQQGKPIVPITATHAMPSSKITSPPTTAPPLPAPRGNIRVLEAPTPPIVSAPMAPHTKFPFDPPPPVALSTAKFPLSQVSDSLPTTGTQPHTKFPQYKVLDAPDPIDLYKTTAPTSTATTTSSSSSGSGKSKHKFDFKFWGKSKDNEK